MRIMVRTLRGDRVALDVDGATTTVAQAKGMVMARERVPVAMQRLFFAGCHLDDDYRTLTGYGVQDDSVLFLGLRLRAADTTPCQYVRVALSRITSNSGKQSRMTSSADTIGPCALPARQGRDAKVAGAGRIHGREA
jgi:hypothetical protein